MRNAIMKSQRHLAATLVVTAGLFAGSAQAQVSSDEIAALRAQLAALQERLAALEAAQQSQASQIEEVTTTNADQQESIDQGADNLARALGESASSGWVARWQWRGDLRYRNENIDAEERSRAIAIAFVVASAHLLASMTRFASSGS